MRDWQPPEHDRIREHTRTEVNQRIDDDTWQALEHAQTEPEIRARLAALDKEWHLDRALIGFFGVLGTLVASKAIRSVWRRRQISGWRMLLWTQLGFLVHHAVRGWCPPVSLLRRVGFRTADEIQAERVTLEKRLTSLGQGISA
jgi:hypothetical protein